MNKKKYQDVEITFTENNDIFVANALREWAEKINFDAEERKREEIKKAREEKIDDILE